jgi:hypothetical protein
MGLLTKSRVVLWLEEFGQVSREPWHQCDEYVGHGCKVGHGCRVTFEFAPYRSLHVLFEQLEVKKLRDSNCRHKSRIFFIRLQPLSYHLVVFVGFGVLVRQVQKQRGWQHCKCELMGHSKAKDCVSSDLVLMDCVSILYCLGA